LLKEKLKILAELTKIRITVFVTLTTVFGYIIYGGAVDISVLVLTTIGILLLACGSAAVNHYQERFTDALMERTKKRPIPSGRISPYGALNISLALILSGTILLITGAGIVPALLGLLNLIWYNGIYTPLKRKNALAIIPGSLVGAIPPAVGWTAAGGSLGDYQIWIISFFFFIWQIPHFWLLLLQISKDYEKAGFPTLTSTFTHEQLARITFMWIMATVVAGFLIPLVGSISSGVFSIGVVLAGIWLTWKSAKLLTHSSEKIYFRFAFREINTFAVMVVILLSLDKIILLF
jgi:heme o synthase